MVDNNTETQKKGKKTKLIIAILLGGMLLGAICMLVLSRIMAHTATNEYCMSCHVHPHAEDSWKLSTHVNNPSGVTVNCVDCHLPPKHTFAYYKEKTRTGLYDLWAYYTKDSTEFDWARKSELDHAVTIVFNESCKECHRNLFPPGLSDDGITAHLYYDENEEKLDLQCISCHLHVGHYDPNAKHERMTGIPGQASATDTERFTEAAAVTEFANYTEQIPGTAVSFNMVAIPGGTFNMGSPDNEPFRNDNEGPVRKVTISPFFMAELEATWDQYWSFYAETMSEGRTPPATIYDINGKAQQSIMRQFTGENIASDIDGVSGPTPPFGFPDQGWGGVDRPVITITYYAAETFCLWLTKKTGKLYRLPTEAEWEYAARGGTETPYFFEGSPKKFSDQGFLRKFIKADTTGINSFVIYEKNSNNKTVEPIHVGHNPFGLKNMSGNVLEYCSDWYAPDAYAMTPSEVTDPKGPESGTEHVVRGGNYASPAENVRSAIRGATQHDLWLKTDPQMPKSIWWYSDIKSIGFRVVCEPETAIKNN